MSNSKRNREQDVKIELTSTQQNPGAAKPEDFTVTKAEIPRPVPGHGQHGRTAREERDLYLEAAGDPGKSTPKATPDRHKA